MKAVEREPSQEVGRKLLEEAFHRYIRLAQVSSA